MEKQVKSKRGFAAMDPEKQRAIARKGVIDLPSKFAVNSPVSVLTSST
jgi:hypothetical protein